MVEDLQGNKFMSPKTLLAALRKCERLRAGHMRERGKHNAEAYIKLSYRAEKIEKKLLARIEKGDTAVKLERERWLKFQSMLNNSI